MSAGAAVAANHVAMGSASELEYHLLLAKDFEAHQTHGAHRTLGPGNGVKAHADRAPSNAEKLTADKLMAES